jgi:hypothetical protein
MSFKTLCDKILNPTYETLNTKQIQMTEIQNIKPVLGIRILDLGTCLGFRY